MQNAKRKTTKSHGIAKILSLSEGQYRGDVCVCVCYVFGFAVAVAHRVGDKWVAARVGGG